MRKFKYLFVLLLISGSTVVFAQEDNSISFGNEGLTETENVEINGLPGDEIAPTAMGPGPVSRAPINQYIPFLLILAATAGALVVRSFNKRESIEE